MTIWTADILDENERRNTNNAVFLYRSSHNPFPHTSIPLGSYRATQACLQPDLQHLNVWLPGLYYFCALTLPPGLTIELFHL